MKKEGKKWMLVVLALLAVITVVLPLVGCKNDSVAEPATHTVTFNSNGGGSIDSQTIVSGQTATKPADPTLENNVFDGWYSDAKFSKSYDFTTPVTGSFTLYAKWVKRIEVTAYDVSSEIAGLTGDGSYILVVTGELNDLSAIKTALSSNKSAKVNLDLSKVSSLTEIGPEAFRECSGLTSISIPEGVKSIGESAFRKCSGLTSISIPEGVKSIGGSAFYGCSGLTSISIPSSVTSIGGNAFRDCSSLTSINIPSSVTSIGGDAFRNCRGLTSISIPEGVKSIGGGAFRECSGLTSISIPSSVTSIGNDAFYGCDSLTSIDLSKATGLTTIGNYAFRGCSGLTSITIPSSVTSIGDDAFYGCSSLTSISIPSSVTSIGNYAFRRCSGATVKVEAENPPTLGSDVFEDVSKILVPKDSVDKYRVAENWKEYSGKIKAIPDQTS